MTFFKIGLGGQFFWRRKLGEQRVCLDSKIRGFPPGGVPVNFRHSLNEKLRHTQNVYIVIVINRTYSNFLRANNVLMTMLFFL